MPPTSKPKRVTLNCTLPPDLAAALQREANERMINASILVERALLAFLPTLPPLDLDGS